ncbi:MAG: hypothetical protein PVH88_22255 [Ignavibacteria bacterium]|jgi:TolB protein
MKIPTSNFISKSILFLLFTLSSCGTTDPEDDTNYHNKILFTSSRSGIAQLYMMNPDGSDIKQITSGEYSHSSGKWSPDAKRIVAGTNEEWSTACYSRMAVMNSDGTNRQVLVCGSRTSWSPDGEKIAFSFTPRAELGDLTSYIYVINADGTNKIQLTDNFGIRDDTPSWSPDGTTIAFSSDRDYLTDYRNEIYLMDADGKNQRRLTYTSLGAGSPQWSPNGNMIAFVENGICLINKDGTDFRRIIDDEAGIGVYRLPQWSPDSNQLAVNWISSDGNVYKKTFIINIDGSGLKQILDDSTAYVSDWSK